MPEFEMLAFYIVTVMIIVVVLRLVIELRRKYDLRCFFIGYFISMVFFYLVLYAILISRFDLVPEIISSAVVALLTLAFVWAELSKRPELEMTASVPIIHDISTLSVFKADYHGMVSKPSTFLRIKEASFPDMNLLFNENLSFSFDLANIGYEEIMVHEYIFYIDGNRQKPIPLGRQPVSERLKLIAQQRTPVDMPQLNIKSAGFHKIYIKALATTEG
jgi:hypothetical protein